MPSVLIVAQVTDGAVHDVSLQCLARARALAGAGKVAAIVLGSGIRQAASSLFGFGADDVYAADGAGLSAFLTTPFKNVLKSFLGAHTFDAVFFPSTTAGNDLASVLAAELNLPCVLDCQNVVENGGALLPQRLEFDRKVTTTFKPAAGSPLLVSLKDGVAETPPADPTRSGTVVDVPAETGRTAARVLSRDVAAKSVNLKGARVIVAAGAGVGTQENFGKIRELAAALDAQIGATRAVVDAGWLPADHQIGQTGATVRPEVYIACGISGAVQHWVGMSEARKIICINLDKNAPLMRRAHYKVAGDLNAVIPKLVKILKG